MKERQLKLLAELTVGSTPEQYRELNLLNYHIEVTENRMQQRFKDPLAAFEGELLKSNQIVKQNYR